VNARRAGRRRAERRVSEQGTVLVVEPDVGNRHLLHAYLQLGGYTVLVAHNRRVALESARAGVDLITLEQLDGSWSIAHELRADPATAAIPMILVTNVDDADREVGVAVQGYVRKPFTRGQILDAVARVLAGSKG
jgi:CheY-like chemotaxis protein